MEVTNEHKERTKDLIRDNRYIEAVKYVKDELSLDLKTAKKLVDAIRLRMEEEDIRMGKKPQQRTVRTSRVINVFFLIPGLVMLGVAIYFFISQQQIINQGNKVSGKVIAYPAQPLFAYEYRGQQYEYQSSTSSDPPAYEMGEEVDLYVDGNDPYNVVVDTFMDRWFVIVLLGGMGGMFAGVSMLTLMLTRRI